MITEIYSREEHLVFFLKDKGCFVSRRSKFDKKGNEFSIYWYKDMICEIYCDFVQSSLLETQYQNLIKGVNNGANS